MNRQSKRNETIRRQVDDICKRQNYRIFWKTEIKYLNSQVKSFIKYFSHIARLCGSEFVVAMN